jgi:hypothetical protein
MLLLGLALVFREFLCRKQLKIYVILPAVQSSSRPRYVGTNVIRGLQEINAFLILSHRPAFRNVCYEQS